VGGRPAGLGGAYAALADGSYGTVWNPAGLAAQGPIELSAMHLVYLQSIAYEYAGLAVPTSFGGGFGAAVQYLRPGSISATDASGNPIGTFGGHYAAYSLGYGQALGPMLAVGAAAKLIDAAIDNVGAQAFAADAGALLKPVDGLRLAAVLSNMSGGMRFLGASDPLPAALRVAAAWTPARGWLLALQGTFYKESSNALEAGVEWKPYPLIALRAGYRTDDSDAPGGTAGLSAGFGLALWGQSFDYAWVPFGVLGDTHYLSLVLRFGEKTDRLENL
jgi:hypothetical protein